MCFARSPEGQAAKRRKKNAASTGEEELQQAKDERPVLRVAKNNTGYWCVHNQRSYYLARVKRARQGPGLVRHCQGGGAGHRAIRRTVDVSLFPFFRTLLSALFPRCVFSLLNL